MPKDEIKALYWFRKAAEQEHEDAIYQIGVFYRDGLGGLEKDRQMAREWFRKAYQHGYGNAQYELEDMDLEDAGKEPKYR